MENKDIIQGLINRDETITRKVFFSTESGISCKGLLCNKLVDFDYIPPEMYYNLLVSDLYSIFMNLDQEGEKMGSARNLKSIKTPEAFFGWIEMIVVRHLQAMKKKNRKFGDLLLENGALNPHIHKEVLLDDDAVKADYRRDFERLLRQMEKRAHAQILRMIILEDLSIKETAVRLGLTEGAVNMRKKRAMLELNELLAQDKRLYHGKE